MTRLLAGVRACWKRRGFRVAHPRRSSLRAPRLPRGRRRAARGRARRADRRSAGRRDLCARGGYGCDAHPRPARRRGVSAPRASRSSATATCTALLLWQRRQRGASSASTGLMLERGADVDAAALRALFAALAGERGAPSARSLAGGGGVAQRPPGRRLARARSGEHRHAVGDRHARRDPAARRIAASAPYRIDRMLQQLRGRGKLAGSPASACGAFIELPRRARTRSRSREAAWSRRSRARSAIPLVTGLPFGHVKDNLRVAGWLPRYARRRCGDARAARAGVTRRVVRVEC